MILEMNVRLVYSNSISYERLLKTRTECERSIFDEELSCSVFQLLHQECFSKILFEDGIDFLVFGFEERLLNRGHANKSGSIH